VLSSHLLFWINRGSDGPQGSNFSLTFIAAVCSSGFDVLLIINTCCECCRLDYLRLKEEKSECKKSHKLSFFLLTMLIENGWVIGRNEQYIQSYSLLVLFCCLNMNRTHGNSYIPTSIVECMILILIIWKTFK